MRVVLMTIAVLLLCAGCPKPENHETVVVTREQLQANVGKPAGTDPAPAATGQPVTEVAVARTCQLADGTEIPVVSVGVFDTDYRDMGTAVAVEGRVAEVFPDRRAFVLVDCERMAGCGDDCCPQAELPVRLAEEQADSLPSQDEVVLVIGDLTVTETGYDLAVTEVRPGVEAG